jgi:hypothetical protein
MIVAGSALRAAMEDHDKGITALIALRNMDFRLQGAGVRAEGAERLKPVVDRRRSLSLEASLAAREPGDRVVKVTNGGSPAKAIIASSKIGVLLRCTIDRTGGAAI